MRARLLAITLDFLSSTFITGSGHPPALLHGSSSWFLGLVSVVLVDWRGLLSSVRSVVNRAGVPLAYMGGASVVDVQSLGSWRVHGGGQAGSIGSGEAQAKSNSKELPSAAVTQQRKGKKREESGR